MTGKIVRGIAGFYYVYVAGSGIYECKAKGIFRKQKLKPLTGDTVRFEIVHEKDMEGNITEILPRKNVLERPPAANVDQAVLFFAAKSPDPNPVLIDRFLIMMDMKGIPCIPVMNKEDLLAEETQKLYEEAYRDSGHPIMFISVKEHTGVEELKGLLKGKTTILAGPSGAGKSSFTNIFQDQVHMETGEISKKLARGKNTTRHCELIPVDETTFLCDTPGFTALDTFGLEKEELKNYYDEFLPYSSGCRFDGCVHISEPDCAVKEALASGRLSGLRYRNYQTIYEDLKEAEQRRYH
ncbi:MAG: ribosome small subunit-dependent GTPase A [Lachnospiraceae bacterium]|nr:ribosome small subunit-dependent GTPase A [Lachnospiraceae bacterium]